MPIYEYKCEKCHHREELIQKHSDAPLTECPKCHGPMTKLIAAPALQFKGSGFYITDYSDKGKDTSESGKTGKKDGAAKPAAESASSTSTTSTEKKADSGGSSSPAKSSGDGKT
ncbi:MAG: FmdB family zinc ribbon protein [Nitrospirota bacterium]